MFHEKIKIMVIVYIIVAVIATILIAALFISNDANYEKSVVIHAPISKVWENVNSHAAMNKWSPWNKRDPNMEQKITGIDGMVGAKSYWNSNVKNVGEGSQTIMKIIKPTLLETKLEFIRPFKSLADAYIYLKEENDSTLVTWGFKSKIPYPMNLMKLFMNFEKSMDNDFGSGLNKLKQLSEN
jgi:hypothetical protein